MDVSLYVTPFTVAMCLILGKFIKSLKVFKWINNNYIPIILLVFGIAFQIFMYGVDKENVVTGFLSAVVSVGLHQQGKTVFASLGDATGWGTSNSTTTDEEEVVSDISDDIDIASDEDDIKG